MSMHLCSDILTSPFSIYEKQFNVDAPRLTFHIGREEYHAENPKIVYKQIQKWCNTHKLNIEHVLPWCTQIPFATLYDDKHKTIQQQHYLLDNGRQTITMDQHNGTMHIIKPFRVDEEQKNGEMKTLQHVSLHVSVNRDLFSVDWIHYTKEKHTILSEHGLTIGVLCGLGLAYFAMS